MTKILVVYYSLTGNTKYIAEAINEELNADIIALKPIKELNPEGGMKYFWGGFQRYMKKKPELEEYALNPNDYDLIILGTPVWAWKYSPPMYSFMSKHDLSGKKVALWMCSAGDGEKAMEKFKEALDDAEIIANIGFQNPLEMGKEEAKEKTVQFAKDILQKMD